MNLKIETQVSTQETSQTAVEPAPEKQLDTDAFTEALNGIATDSIHDASAYILKSRAPTGE